jgi:hypothetical protein
VGATLHEPGDDAHGAPPSLEGLGDCTGLEGEEQTGIWIPIDEILAREVSLYGKVTDAKAKMRLDLARVVNFVRSDGDLKSKIEQIRAAIQDGASEDEVRELKKQLLPAFSTSGVFPGRRKGDCPVEHTGLLQVDLDDVAPEDADDMIERLRQDPHIVAVFRSPKGHHLKAIVAIPRDAGLHQRSFEAVRRYFLYTYDARLDPSTKDVTRLCYFSHDPEIHVACGAVHQFEPVEESGSGESEVTTESPISSQHVSSVGTVGTVASAEAVPAKRYSTRMVRSALAAIAQGGRPDYDPWLKLISATRDAIGNDDLAMTLLQEFFPEETRGEYAVKFREGLNRIPAKHLFDEAGKHSWQPIDASRIDLCAMLAKGPARRALERAPEIIAGLLRCGWLLLLAGKTKARKSFMAIDLALSVVLGRNLFGDYDLEGFHVTMGDALIFDIENPIDEAAERLCAALEAISDPCERREAAGRIRLHALRGLDLGALTDAIIAEIRRSVVPGTLVVVDCFYPLFTGDINDSTVVSASLRRFSNVAEEKGCGVVVIDHFRKGGFGSPGDQVLGSVAKSMAPDAVVTMERRGREDVFLISADIRGFPSFNNLVVCYDETARRFRLAGPETARDPNRAQRDRCLLDKMRRAWRGQPEARLSRAECEIPWRVQGPSARATLARMAERGWVEQSGTGRNIVYALTPLGQSWLEGGADDIFEL